MSAIFASLILLLFSANTVFATEIGISTRQMQTLGISTAVLPTKSTGELAGIPAQVIIPGNQLFIVSTPMAAMVEQMLVGVGDHVRKGQVLARLQSPALAEAQRGMLQAGTQAQLARENFTRDEQLWKDGIIAESRYRSSRSQNVEASAALAEKIQVLKLAGMSATAIAALQAGENLNSLLSITSPITGVILEKSADAGQRLDSAMPLFKVAILNPLGLEIQAPLKSTLGIREGAVVNIAAYGASGKIIAMGHGLSDGNQTILLRALITKGTQHLRPGQHVEASIATGERDSPQWNIPNGALARIDNKVMIFIKTANGFKAQEVTVLHEGAQSTLISGTLTGKETFAVSGVAALKAQLMGIGGGE